MLSEEQRQEIKKKITSMGRLGGVTAEDLEAFPASREEIMVTTSVGGTRVIKFEFGEKREERPVIINFHGGGFIAGRNDRDELFCRRQPLYGGRRICTSVNSSRCKRDRKAVY